MALPESYFVPNVESPLEPYVEPFVVKPDVPQYAYVKAVILYWEDTKTHWDDPDSVRDHVREAKEMESVFKSLNFETEIHPIPKDDSQSDTRAFMLQQQILFSTQETLPVTSSLLIIHYISHRGIDDDYRDPGYNFSKRSEAFQRLCLRSPPDVGLNEIQNSIRSTSFDCLLLLDCFRSTQDWKGAEMEIRAALSERFQLIAATESKTGIKFPAEPSFTAAIAMLMRDHIRRHDRVDVSNLYTDLMSRMARKQVVPFMLTGHSIGTITLQKLPAPGNEADRVMKRRENTEITTPVGYPLPQLKSQSKTDYSSYSTRL